MDTNAQWPFAPVGAPEAPRPEPEPAFDPRPQGPDPAFEGRRQGPIRRRLSAIGAAIVALLAKLKAILVLLPR